MSESRLSLSTRQWAAWQAWTKTGLWQPDSGSPLWQEPDSVSGPYLLIKGHACDQLDLLLEAQGTFRCGWHPQAPLSPLKDDSHNGDLVEGPAPTKHPPPVREGSSTEPGSSRPARAEHECWLL